MIQDKEKEVERLKAEVARLEESNKARQAQFDQLAAAKHQLEVSVERGNKTADSRAEALKNFEMISTQQETIQVLRRREEDLTQHLQNISEMVISKFFSFLLPLFRDLLDLVRLFFFALGCSSLS